MGKKILFVCNGNVWRSQIAEYMFNKMFTNFHAISAGISGSHVGKTVREEFTRAGLPSVFNELEKEGVDIENNKCKLVTNGAIEGSDVIFVMERSQKTS